MSPLPSIMAISGTLWRRVVTTRGLSYTTLIFAHADVFPPSVYPALYLSIPPHLLRSLLREVLVHNKHSTTLNVGSISRG